MLDRREILQRAQQAISDVFFGVLTTVDAQGVPSSRYMGALATRHGLKHLYALTANHMRKSEDLSANPNVCWLFARPDYEEVVRLTGRARLISDATVMQELFNRLMVVARDQSLQVLSAQANAEYQVIDTQVDAVQLLCPPTSTVPMVASLVDASSGGASAPRRGQFVQGDG